MSFTRRVVYFDHYGRKHVVFRSMGDDAAPAQVDPNTGAPTVTPPAETPKHPTIIGIPRNLAIAGAIGALLLFGKKGA